MPAIPHHRKAEIGRRFVQQQHRRATALTMRLQIFGHQQGERAVRRYLTKQKTFFPAAYRVPCMPESKTMEDDILPSEEDRLLQILISPDLASQYVEAADLAADLMGQPHLAGDDARVLNYLYHAADRVVGINETTRDQIRLTLLLGAQREYTPWQIAHGVPEDEYGGILGAVEETYHNRAETIARTELAQASAQAAIDTYRESDIEYVDVLDGPDCGWLYHDDPDLADGSRRTMDDADEHELAHPNCVRVFLPVIGPVSAEEAEAAQESEDEGE